MRKVFAAIPLTFCMCSNAVEFDNSLGFGLQYGGVVGWQGSISSDYLHGRVGLGLIGFYGDPYIISSKALSLGGDLSVNNYISVGFTSAQLENREYKFANINYYFSGKYTEGWRVGLDAGTEIHDLEFFEVESKFVFFSFGYSFK